VNSALRVVADWGSARKRAPVTRGQRARPPARTQRAQTARAVSVKRQGESSAPDHDVDQQQDDNAQDDPVEPNDAGTLDMSEEVKLAGGARAPDAIDEGTAKQQRTVDMLRHRLGLPDEGTANGEGAALGIQPHKEDMRSSVSADEGRGHNRKHGMQAGPSNVPAPLCADACVQTDSGHAALSLLRADVCAQTDSVQEHDNPAPLRKDACVQTDSVQERASMAPALRTSLVLIGALLALYAVYALAANTDVHEALPALADRARGALDSVLQPARAWGAAAAQDVGQVLASARSAAGGVKRAFGDMQNPTPRQPTSRSAWLRRRSVRVRRASCAQSAPLAWQPARACSTARCCWTAWWRAAARPAACARERSRSTLRCTDDIFTAWSYRRSVC
jgi:hypothetical protein